MGAAKMTASELANLLEVDSWYKLVTREEIATMLRQQQAEIEALKKDNKELHAIAQRMAMAESDARKSLQWFKDAKERQSEPVAWMDDLSFFTEQPDDMDGVTPLYTHQYERPHNTVLVPCDKLAEMQAEIETLKAHPVKELDEQFKKGFEAGKEEGWKAHKFHYPVKELTDEEIDNLIMEVAEKPTNEDLHDFARAILKRASEK